MTRAQGESSRTNPEGVTALPSGTPPDGELEQAIAALRARVDEEFRIAERLDSKIRQVVAFAAGFFVVIQTVAFGSFAEDQVSSTERAVVLVCAIVAAVAVAIAVFKASRGEELVEEADLAPAAIVRWANDAGRNPEYVRSRLVRGLADVAKSRARSNADRAAAYDRVANYARIAIILSSVELIVAIATRL